MRPPPKYDLREAVKTTIRIRPLVATATLAASLLAVHALNAQPSGGSYTLRKQVVGAGEVSSAGPYRLTGTLAEVGAAESASPRFRLIGGFHGPSGPIVESIFCDGFEAVPCP